MIIPLHLHPIDAADLEAACRRAATAHEEDAKTAETEQAEGYHRRIATRYRELGELVKRHSSPVREAE